MAIKIETAQDQLMYDWVEWLQSGEFQQCSGALTKVYQDETQHCCLGLLTHKTVDRFSLEIREPVTFSDCVRYFDGEINYSNFLPIGIADYLDINETGAFSIPVSRYYPNVEEYESGGRGEYMGPNDKFESNLANLNDNFCTFPQIADVIEYCWTYGYFYREES